MGPMVSPSWLAATADRERTVGVLRAGFVEGRLSQDELNERIAQAYASRTYADLWALTADLPAGPLPYPQALPHSQALPYPQGLPHPQGLPYTGLYPPGTAYPQGFGPPPDPALPSDGSASSWQSGAALLVLAMVIFTLAALVTAIVTAHAQTGMLAPAQQGPAIVLPFQEPASVIPAPGQQGTIAPFVILIPNATSSVKA
jgi:Domain of unknown function (DUF1707)